MFFFWGQTRKCEVSEACAHPCACEGQTLRNIFLKGFKLSYFVRQGCKPMPGFRVRTGSSSRRSGGGHPDTEQAFGSRTAKLRTRGWRRPRFDARNLGTSATTARRTLEWTSWRFVSRLDFAFMMMSPG